MRIMPQPFNYKVWAELLHERHHQVRGVLPCGSQRYKRNSHQSRRQKLQNQLHASGEAEIAFAYYLDVIVSKTNCPKSHSGKNCKPDINVGEIGPQQRWHHDSNRDQHAAHSRSTGLFLVFLRTLLTDVLSDLKFAQLPDDCRSDDQPHKQSCETCEGRSEGDIAKNAERRKILIQPLIKKPVEQCASGTVVST